MLEIMPFGPSAMVHIILFGGLLSLLVFLAMKIIIVAFTKAKSNKEDFRKEASSLQFYKERIAKFAMKHRIAPERVNDVFAELEASESCFHEKIFQDFKSSFFEDDLEMKKNGEGININTLQSAYNLLMQAVMNGSVNEEQANKMQAMLSNASKEVEVEAIIHSIVNSK